MRYARKVERLTIHDRRSQTIKLSSNQNARRKENQQILGDIGSWHHKPVEMKEKIEKYLRNWKKNWKDLKVFQKNEKFTRDKTLKQKPWQRDKYVGCPPRKILCTNLEVDLQKT